MLVTSGESISGLFGFTQPRIHGFMGHDSLNFHVNYVIIALKKNGGFLWLVFVCVSKKTACLTQWFHVLNTGQKPIKHGEKGTGSWRWNPGLLCALCALELLVYVKVLEWLELWDFLYLCVWFDKLVLCVISPALLSSFTFQNTIFGWKNSWWPNYDDSGGQGVNRHLFQKEWIEHVTSRKSVIRVSHDKI